MIHTSLNIHIDIMNIINSEAEKRKISRRKLILLCLNEIVIGKKLPKKLIVRAMKYQDADSNSDNWHTFHISYTSGEIQYIQDLKNVFKMSASLLVAIAVKKFRNEVNHDTDNYLLNIHFFIGEVQENVQTWTQYWGIPSRLNIPTDNNRSKKQE